MNTKKQATQERPVDPERKMALKRLPPHIREQMTPEEIELFLYGEEWPDALFQKLDEFIIKDDENS
ncbi:MAG: hypothetical protein V1793_23405 [Pseudomonadota bacterium]